MSDKIHIPLDLVVAATRGRKVDCLQVVSTRPVVASTVSYADVREGHDPYRACGHGTHSHPTATRTVRGGCLCQHQAETGLDGWYGEHRSTLDKRRQN